MIALEVFVNGQRLCVAGIGADGVLSTIVNWAGKRGHDDIFMHVGGLDSTTNKHLRWSVPKIGVGTEITIKVIETTEVDAPTPLTRDWDGYTEGKAEA